MTDDHAAHATDTDEAPVVEGPQVNGRDAAAHGDEPEEPEEYGADEDAGGPGGLTWGKVAILGLALAFLGFAVGVVATRDNSPAADSVDVGFLQDMSTHHDQGIGVARLAAAYGEDPTVRSYAREIIAAQSYELGLMSQMLADWGYSRDERSDEAMGWMGMPVPVDQMPGLLTDEQLDQVDAARGAELDALFLDLMAEHHRGGLHMAAEAAQNAGDETIRDLAARMEHAQAGEINEYRYTAQQLGLDIDIPGADVPPANLPDRES
ncbi:MAG TPA: DUF305 domain-containing protein [Acidimicrobiales bacterium]|nr:DUF305 domain-containing protein [Acidimicrobiales bacterium]